MQKINNNGNHFRDSHEMTNIIYDVEKSLKKRKLIK